MKKQSGFTLVEILVVIVILILVVGAIANALSGRRAFNNEQSAIRVLRAIARAEGEFSKVNGSFGSFADVRPRLSGRHFSEQRRHGYCFQVFCSPKTAEAEAAWCAYAWPESYLRTGRRTFYVSQDGTMMATTPDHSYTGVGAVQDANAWQRDASKGWHKIE